MSLQTDPGQTNVRLKEWQWTAPELWSRVITLLQSASPQHAAKGGHSDQFISLSWTTPTPATGPRNTEPVPLICTGPDQVPYWPRHHVRKLQAQTLSYKVHNQPGFIELTASQRSNTWQEQPTAVWFVPPNVSQRNQKHFSTSNNRNDIKDFVLPIAPGVNFGACE